MGPLTPTGAGKSTQEIGGNRGRWMGQEKGRMGGRKNWEQWMVKQWLYLGGGRTGGKNQIPNPFPGLTLFHWLDPSIIIRAIILNWSVLDPWLVYAKEYGLDIWINSLLLLGHKYTFPYSALISPVLVEVHLLQFNPNSSNDSQKHQIILATHC